MQSRSPKNRLRHYFAGLSEHVFQTHLGVVDTQLTDYITDMLIRFTRSDHLHRILHRRGTELDKMPDMLRKPNKINTRITVSSIGRLATWLCFGQESSRNP